MNLFVLGPLVVGLILAAVRAFVSRRPADPSAIYRYDPVLTSLIFGVSIILFSVPLWLPYVQPGKDNNIVYLGTSFIAAIGFVGCFWLFNFRVLITDEYIEYGAVLRKILYFSDIRRIKVAKNDAKGMIAIYPNKGFRIVFTYTLQSYSALKIDILKKVPSAVSVEYW